MNKYDLFLEEVSDTSLMVQKIKSYSVNIKVLTFKLGTIAINCTFYSLAVSQWTIICWVSIFYKWRGFWQLSVTNCRVNGQSKCKAAYGLFLWQVASHLLYGAVFFLKLVRYLTWPLSWIFFLKKCVLINELVYNKISVYGTAASFLLKCIFSQFCIL